MEDNHQWKDGARIAILPTVILCLISAFSDLQDRYPDQDDGDQTHEDQDEISGEFHGSLEKAEKFVHTIRSGAEVFPNAVKELNKRGHELAAHSYTQDTILPYLSPEEEREVIRKCCRVIE